MKTATARGASTRTRNQAESATQAERRVTFDIRDRNDVDGHGEAYRIYQLEGDPQFFVDKTSGDEVVHDAFGSLVAALESVGRHCGVRAPETA